MKEFVLENPPRRRRRDRSASRRGRSSRRRASRRRSPSRRRVSRRRAASSTRVRRRRRRSPRIIRGTFVKLNPMNIKSVFAKDTLTIAAGAVSSSVVSNLVIGRFGRFLPGIMSPFGRAAYNVLLPVAGAIVLQKFKLSPNLAKGMVIGGIANGLGQLLTATRVLPAGTVVNAAPALPAAPVAPTGEYLGSGMGEYLGEYLGGDADAVGAAFATDAWN